MASRDRDRERGGFRNTFERRGDDRRDPNEGIRITVPNRETPPQRYGKPKNPSLAEEESIRITVPNDRKAKVEDETRWQRDDRDGGHSYWRNDDQGQGRGNYPKKRFNDYEGDYGHPDGHGKHSRGGQYNRHDNYNRGDYDNRGRGGGHYQDRREQYDNRGKGRGRPYNRNRPTYTAHYGGGVNQHGGRRERSRSRSHSPNKQRRLSRSPDRGGARDHRDRGYERDDHYKEHERSYSPRRESHPHAYDRQSPRRRTTPQYDRRHSRSRSPGMQARERSNSQTAHPHVGAMGIYDDDLAKDWDRDNPHSERKRSRSLSAPKESPSHGKSGTMKQAKDLIMSKFSDILGGLESEDTGKSAAAGGRGADVDDMELFGIDEKKPASAQGTPMPGIALDQNIEDEDEFLYGDMEQKVKPEKAKEEPKKVSQFTGLSALQDYNEPDFEERQRRKQRSQRPPERRQEKRPSVEHSASRSRERGRDEASNSSKGSDIDSKDPTIQNLLKSIGFNFELSRQMQEKMSTDKSDAPSTQHTDRHWSSPPKDSTKKKAILSNEESYMERARRYREKHMSKPDSPEPAPPPMTEDPHFYENREFEAMNRPVRAPVAPMLHRPHPALLPPTKTMPSHPTPQPGAPVSQYTFDYQHQTAAQTLVPQMHPAYQVAQLPEPTPPQRHHVPPISTSPPPDEPFVNLPPKSKWEKRERSRWQEERERSPRRSPDYRRSRSPEKRRRSASPDAKRHSHDKKSSRRYDYKRPESPPSERRSHDSEPEEPPHQRKIVVSMSKEKVQRHEKEQRQEDIAALDDVLAKLKDAERKAHVQQEEETSRLEEALEKTERILEALHPEQKQLQSQQRELRSRGEPGKRLLLANEDLMQDVKRKILLYKGNWKDIAAKLTSIDGKPRDMEKMLAKLSKSGSKASATTKKKEEPKKAKLKKMTINYEYFDPGNHWCKSCNVNMSNMHEALFHLRSKKHTTKLDPYDRPWMPDTKPTPARLKGQTAVAPIKGVEFLMATQAFYCVLCKSFMGDNLCAELHLKSDEHNEAYERYVQENPVYEQRRNLDKAAGLSLIRQKERDDDEEETKAEEMEEVPEREDKADYKREKERLQELKKLREKEEQDHKVKRKQDFDKIVAEKRRKYEKQTDHEESDNRDRDRRERDSKREDDRKEKDRRDKRRGDKREERRSRERSPSQGKAKPVIGKMPGKKKEEKEDDKNRGISIKFGGGKPQKSLSAMMQQQPKNKAPALTKGQLLQKSQALLDAVKKRKEDEKKKKEQELDYDASLTNFVDNAKEVDSESNSPSVEKPADAFQSDLMRRVQEAVKKAERKLMGIECEEEKREAEHKEDMKLLGIECENEDEDKVKPPPIKPPPQVDSSAKPKAGTSKATASAADLGVIFYGHGSLKVKSGEKPEIEMPQEESKHVMPEEAPKSPARPVKVEAPVDSGAQQEKMEVSDIALPPPPVEKDTAEISETQENREVSDIALPTEVKTEKSITCDIKQETASDVDLSGKDKENAATVEALSEKDAASSGEAPYSEERKSESPTEELANLADNTDDGGEVKEKTANTDKVQKEKVGEEITNKELEETPKEKEHVKGDNIKERSEGMPAKPDVQSEKKETENLASDGGEKTEVVEPKSADTKNKDPAKEDEQQTEMKVRTTDNTTGKTDDIKKDEAITVQSKEPEKMEVKIETGNDASITSDETRDRGADEKPEGTDETAAEEVLKVEEVNVETPKEKENEKGDDIKEISEDVPVKPEVQSEKKVEIESIRDDLQSSKANLDSDCGEKTGVVEPKNEDPENDDKVQIETEAAATNDATEKTDDIKTDEVMTEQPKEQEKVEEKIETGNDASIKADVNGDGGADEKPEGTDNTAAEEGVKADS